MPFIYSKASSKVNEYFELEKSEKFTFLQYQIFVLLISRKKRMCILLIYLYLDHLWQEECTFYILFC